MKKATLALLVFFSFLLLVVIFRLLQFDPSSLKETFPLRSGHSAPSSVTIESLGYDLKSPFLVKLYGFEMRAQNSAVRASLALQPLTVSEIISGVLRPNSLLLEDASFNLSSFGEMAELFGNPFSGSRDSLDVFRRGRDFYVRGTSAEISLGDSFYPLPSSMRLKEYLWEFVPDGFQRLRGKLTSWGIKNIRLDFSSDPARQLMILNLNKPKRFLFKTEFFQDESGTLQARLYSEFSRFDVSTVFPSAWKQYEFFQAPTEGRIDLRFQPLGFAEGGFRGQGILGLHEGALRNINLPHEVLTSLTRLPLFSHLMEEDWGGGLLKSGDTAFEEGEIEFSVAGKEILIRNIALESKEITISLTGSLSFEFKNGASNLKGSLLVKGAMATELLQREPLFAALATPGGIRIPFMCLGNFPGLQVETDINFVSAQILKTEGEQIAAKGVDSLNRYMESKR